jgi:hydroxyacylglutathione hydrolase
MLMRQIVDQKLAQYAYLLGCQQSGEAIVIDPERDVDRYIALAKQEGLRIVAVAETHIHADFLSGTREMAARIPGLMVYLSDEGGEDWTYEWPAADNARVARLRDGDTFKIGNIEFRAWHTPGHTPEHLAFVVTDCAAATAPVAVLTGDFVFAGDVGRPDLLESAAGVMGTAGPLAARLYASVRRFLELPDFVQIWPGHGAGSACGKSLGAVPASTVGYERRFSKAMHAAAEGERSFVAYVLGGQPEPPPYFGRMKRLNRTGAPVTHGLPAPQRLTPSELCALADEHEVRIVDTRLDRKTVFDGYIAGSLYAPLNRTFSTITGSFLDPEKAVVLLIDQDRVEEAIRDLVRIGIDQVRAWAPVSVLHEASNIGLSLSTIESIDYVELERRRQGDAIAILDVRSAAEHASRHIPEVSNIPHILLPARAGELNPREALYVHCLSGARASVAAVFLAGLGINAIHVDGHFASWQTDVRVEASA